MRYASTMNIKLPDTFVHVDEFGFPSVCQMLSLTMDFTSLAVSSEITNTKYSRHKYLLHTEYTEVSDIIFI